MRLQTPRKFGIMTSTKNVSVTMINLRHDKTRIHVQANYLGECKKKKAKQSRQSDLHTCE